MVRITTTSGKSGCADPCIASLVQALNGAGFETVASCCGHGYRPGNIVLKDGRELVIARSREESRKIDALFPIDINGDRVADLICPAHGKALPCEYCELLKEKLSEQGSEPVVPVHKCAGCEKTFFSPEGRDHHEELCLSEKDST